MGGLLPLSVCIVPREGPEFKHYVFGARRTLVCREAGLEFDGVCFAHKKVRNSNDDRLKFVGQDAGTEVDNSQSDS